jgi:hypothetical protein
VVTVSRALFHGALGGSWQGKVSWNSPGERTLVPFLLEELPYAGDAYPIKNSEGLGDGH